MICYQLVDLQLHIAVSSLCYIIQIVYPLRSIRSDTAAFWLKSFPKIHLRKQTSKSETKLKSPILTFSRLFKSFCTPISYLGSEIFLAEFITSNRGITSRMKGNRFVLAAGLCSVYPLTALAQQCSAMLPPFLVRLLFPPSLTTPLPGRTYLLCLSTSHSSQCLLVSLAPALPQPLGQGGVNSRPNMWHGKDLGGHLTLSSVSAEGKSQWHGRPSRSSSKLMNRENCSNKFLASSSHFMQLQHYIASLVTTSASQSVHTPGS